MEMMLISILPNNTQSRRSLSVRHTTAFDLWKHGNNDTKCFEIKHAKYYNMPEIISTETNVVQLIEHRTGTPVTQVRLPQQRIFLPINSSVQTLLRCPFTPCAIACINICVHVKVPVVHIRVRWIMEALNHPACTVRRVARLCRSWLTRGKQPEFPMGEIPL